MSTYKPGILTPKAARQRDLVYGLYQAQLCTTDRGTPVWRSFEKEKSTDDDR